MLETSWFFSPKAFRKGILARDQISASLEDQV